MKRKPNVLPPSIYTNRKSKVFEDSDSEGYSKDEERDLLQHKCSEITK